MPLCWSVVVLGDEPIRPAPVQGVQGGADAAGGGLQVELAVPHGIEGTGLEDHARLFHGIRHLFCFGSIESDGFFHEHVFFGGGGFSDKIAMEIGFGADHNAIDGGIVPGIHQVGPEIGIRQQPEAALEARMAAGCVDNKHIEAEQARIKEHKIFNIKQGEQIMYNSLLAHLYPYIKGSQEDIATYSLQYLLSQSDKLNIAFTKMAVEKMNIELENKMQYLCQVTGESEERERPDIPETKTIDMNDTAFTIDTPATYTLTEEDTPYNISRIGVSFVAEFNENWNNDSKKYYQISITAGSNKHNTDNEFYTQSFEDDSAEYGLANIEILTDKKLTAGNAISVNTFYCADGLTFYLESLTLYYSEWNDIDTEQKRIACSTNYAYEKGCDAYRLQYGIITRNRWGAFDEKKSYWQVEESPTASDFFIKDGEYIQNGLSKIYFSSCWFLRSSGYIIYIAFAELL